MLNWITCYLSGRHDYQVACEPGAIFLRCRYCDKRSSGWELHAERRVEARIPVTPPPRQVPARPSATR